MRLQASQAKYFALLILSVFVLAMSSFKITEAHPGNTAADGGHYCWTRCEYWGEVYGQRHFHNGSSGASPSTEEEYVPEPNLHDSPEDKYDTGGTSAPGATNSNPELDDIDDRTSDTDTGAEELSWWVIGAGGVISVIGYYIFKYFDKD